MSEGFSAPDTQMGPRKKTLQEEQETTPVDRRTSQRIPEHNALSPHKKMDGRQKRRRGLDLQGEGTPNKKVCPARKHPIVMLTHMTLESPATSSQNTQELDDGVYADQELPALSPYELERLRNIKENAKFFQSLKLLESASLLSSSTKNQNKPRGIKREKKVTPVAETSRRRSMRLQRIDVSGTPLPIQLEDPQPALEERPMKPPGPLEMTPINIQDDKATFDSFLTTWGSTSQEVTSSSNTLKSKDLKSYIRSLQGMSLQEKAVAKVVRDRIFSVAVHPSQSRILVAAGDKWGQVGLWDLDHQSPDDGVYAFTPHSRPVSCMHFSPSNSAHLVSLSYDGTVRCGDVTRLVFDEIYRNSEDSFSAFDFLSPDAAVLLVSHLDADLSLVDRRTPGTDYEHRASLGMKSARTVSVHPLNRDLCAVAGGSDVHIYDVRKIHPRKMQPVLSLTSHTKSVSSAYFSPETGNRILTTCADNLIRVYDSSALSSTAPLVNMIRHDNNTGRWLTRFRAVWDPKQEGCFVIGSLARPRQIEVYHEEKLLHSFRDSEYLGTVCSINAVHPSRSLLVGGNASGRLHVFCD